MAIAQLFFFILATNRTFMALNGRQIQICCMYAWKILTNIRSNIINSEADGFGRIGQNVYPI
jgi:hypothetical protein